MTKQKVRRVNRAALEAKPETQSEAEETPPSADKAAQEEALLEARIARAANKMLVGIPQAIDTAVENRVKALREETAATLKRIQDESNARADEIKQLILSGPVAAQQPPPPGNNGQAARDALIRAAGEPASDAWAILGSKLLDFATGNKGNGAGSLEVTMQTLTGAMNLVDAISQRPKIAALKEVSELLKAGSGAGLSTKQLGDGLDRIIATQSPTSAADIFKVKPGV